MPVVYLAWKRTKSVIALMHVYAFLDHCLNIDCEASLVQPIAKHRKFYANWGLKYFPFVFKISMTDHFTKLATDL